MPIINTIIQIYLEEEFCVRMEDRIEYKMVQVGVAGWRMIVVVHKIVNVEVSLDISDVLWNVCRQT